MNSTSIFLITKGSPIETALFLDNLFDKTQGNFSVNIYDYYEGNDDMTKMLQTACEKTNGEYVQILKKNDVYTVVKRGDTTNEYPNELNKSMVYNMMLANLKEEYAVFMSINYILSKNWLVDILYYYKGFHNSGCVSLKHTYKNMSLSVALFSDETTQEDKLKPIWFNQHNYFTDFVFFSKQKAKTVGDLDITLGNNGLELAEWSFRFLKLGLSNYQIKQNSVIKYKIDNDFLFPEITDKAKQIFKDKINVLMKKQSQQN